MQRKTIDQEDSVVEFSGIDLIADGNMSFRIDERDGDGTTSVYLEAAAAVECIWKIAEFLRDHHPGHFHAFAADMGKKAFAAGLRVPPGMQLALVCKGCRSRIVVNVADHVENWKQNLDFICGDCEKKGA